MLAVEELLQLVGVDTGHRNVRTDTVDHKREQQKDEPATQVTVLACFCERCAGCHRIFRS